MVSFVFLSVLLSALVHNNCLTIKQWLRQSGGQTVDKRHFSLVLPEDLAEWLDREAAHQGRTRNNLINRILEQYRKKSTNKAK